MNGSILIVLYLLTVLAPAGLVLATGEPAVRDTLYEAGKGCGLTGSMLLVLQVVLAGRFKLIERPFGHDVLIRFHRNMAVLAVALLASHPLLLAVGGAGFGLLTTLTAPWYVMFGKFAFALLALQTAASLLSRRLKLPFEPWRRMHNLGAVAVIGMALTHGALTGSDMLDPTLRGIWIGLGAAWALLFGWHRLLRPWLLARNPWTITEVRPEAGEVWTLTMEPPEGKSMGGYLPGQFHFLTLKRGRGLPEEEHHFTISSSPTEDGLLRSTIKSLGDFTATVGLTRPGDQAVVHGPFGRFSHLLHDTDDDLVLVAGGIGITPLRAMLRHMADVAAQKRVLLIYANRTERDIVFREELDELAQTQWPELTVVHVLSRPGKNWGGERGRADSTLLKRLVGESATKRSYWVCGPAGLVAATLAALRTMGVPDSRIHKEIFSLLD